MNFKPEIKIILEQGVYKIIQKGVSTSSIVTFMNKSVFHKHRRQYFYYILPFRKFLLYLAYRIRSSVPMLAFKIKMLSREYYIQKECQTIHLWEKAGIRVPEIYHYSNKSITYEYLENIIPFKFLLEKDPKRDKPFLELIKLHNKIRLKALQENNPFLFHSDCHIGNYVYDRQQNEVIPIDPETVLCNDTPIETIDQGLNLHFLYSLQSLRVDTIYKDQFSRLFINSLDQKTIQGMRQMNTVTSFYRFLAFTAGVIKFACFFRK